jgi:hypothetical protein
VAPYRGDDPAAEVARLRRLGAGLADVGQGDDVSLDRPGRPGGQRVLRPVAPLARPRRSAAGRAPGDQFGGSLGDGQHGGVQRGPRAFSTLASGSARAGGRTCGLGHRGSILELAE